MRKEVCGGGGRGGVSGRGAARGGTGVGGVWVIGTVLEHDGEGVRGRTRVGGHVEVEDEGGGTRSGRDMYVGKNEGTGGGAF